MNAAEALRTRILGRAEAVAILGGEHVFPQVVPDPVNAPANYIVFQEIAAPPDNHLEGQSGLTRYLFQVSCISQNPDTARALRKEVSAAAIGSNGPTFSAHVEDQRMQYVEQVRKHDAQIDIVIWSRDT